MKEKGVEPGVNRTKWDNALANVRDKMESTTADIRDVRELMMQLEQRLEKVLTPARPIYLDEDLEKAQAVEKDPASPIIEELEILRKFTLSHSFEIEGIGRLIREIMERLEV